MYAVIIIIVLYFFCLHCLYFPSALEAPVTDKFIMCVNILGNKAPSDSDKNIAIINVGTHQQISAFIQLTVWEMIHSFIQSFSIIQLILTHNIFIYIKKICVVILVKDSACVYLKSQPSSSILIVMHFCHSFGIIRMNLEYIGG